MKRSRISRGLQIACLFFVAAPLVVAQEVGEPVYLSANTSTIVDVSKVIKAREPNELELDYLSFKETKDGVIIESYTEKAADLVQLISPLCAIALPGSASLPLLFKCPPEEKDPKEKLKQVRDTWALFVAESQSLVDNNRLPFSRELSIFRSRWQRHFEHNNVLSGSYLTDGQSFYPLQVDTLINLFRGSRLDKPMRSKTGKAITFSPFCNLRVTEAVKVIDRCSASLHIPPFAAVLDMGGKTLTLTPLQKSIFRAILELKVKRPAKGNSLTTPFRFPVVLPAFTPTVSPSPMPTRAPTVTSTPMPSPTRTPTATSTPTPTVKITQCRDGIDNDGDGAVDMQDFSCLNDPRRDDEANPKSRCQDSIDNDGDGAVDLADFSCQNNKQKNDELTPANPLPPRSLARIEVEGIDPNGVVMFPQTNGFTRKFLTIINKGIAAAEGLSFRLMGEGFSVEPSSECKQGGTLQPGKKCQLLITAKFDPARGLTGTMSMFFIGSDGIPVYFLSVPASLPPTPTPTPSSPPRLETNTLANFPDTRVGFRSSPQSLEVRNTGGAEAFSLAIGIPPGFVRTDDGVFNRCTDRLMPGASCKVGISFAPQWPGLVQTAGRITYGSQPNPGVSNFAPFKVKGFGRP